MSAVSFEMKKWVEHLPSHQQPCIHKEELMLLLAIWASIRNVECDSEDARTGCVFVKDGVIKVVEGGVKELTAGQCVAYRYGREYLEGGYMYLDYYPTWRDVKAIAQAGIKKITFAKRTQNKNDENEQGVLKAKEVSRRYGLRFVDYVFNENYISEFLSLFYELKKSVFKRREELGNLYSRVWGGIVAMLLSKHSSDFNRQVGAVLLSRPVALAENDVKSEGPIWSPIGFGWNGMRHKTDYYENIWSKKKNEEVVTEKNDMELHAEQNAIINRNSFGNSSSLSVYEIITTLMPCAGECSKIIRMMGMEAYYIFGYSKGGKKSEDTSSSCIYEHYNRKEKAIINAIFLLQRHQGKIKYRITNKLWTRFFREKLGREGDRTLEFVRKEKEKEEEEEDEGEEEEKEEVDAERGKMTEKEEEVYEKRKKQMEKIEDTLRHDKEDVKWALLVFSNFKEFVESPKERILKWRFDRFPKVFM